MKHVRLVKTINSLWLKKQWQLWYEARQIVQLVHNGLPWIKQPWVCLIQGSPIIITKKRIIYWVDKKQLQNQAKPN